MVWVPELRTKGHADPWRHRKGEPRAFALLWCIYLFGCSAVTLLGVEQSWPPSTDQYEFPARVLLTMMMFGVAVLWPCVRLSQATPRNPAAASIADALVVLIPAQTLIWPMVLLLAWPWTVVAFIAALTAAWSCVSMGVCAWGVTNTQAHIARRMHAIAAALAAALAAGLVGVVWTTLTADQPPQWVWAWCPLTAVWAATEPQSMLAPLTIDRMMWAGAAVPAALGLGLWAAVALHATTNRQTPPSEQQRKHEG